MTTSRAAIAAWTALVLGYILGALGVIPGAGLVTIVVIWVVGMLALTLGRQFLDR